MLDKKKLPWHKFQSKLYKWKKYPSCRYPFAFLQLPARKQFSLDSTKKYYREFCSLYFFVCV